MGLMCFDWGVHCCSPRQSKGSENMLNGVYLKSGHSTIKERNRHSI